MRVLRLEEWPESIIDQSPGSRRPSPHGRRTARSAGWGAVRSGSIWVP